MTRRAIGIAQVAALGELACAHTFPEAEPLLSLPLIGGLSGVAVSALRRGIAELPPALRDGLTPFRRACDDVALEGVSLAWLAQLAAVAEADVPAAIRKLADAARLHHSPTETTP